MKKIIPIIAALFILLIDGAALADEPIMENAEMLDSSLYPTINYIQKSAGGLPYLIYKYIIYVPLDEYHTNLIGLNVTETNDNIIINKLADDGTYRHVPSSEEKAFGGVMTAVCKDAALNGQNSSTDYPFIRYNETLYLPLTWDNAAAIGITIDNSNGNMLLYSDNRFYTLQSSAIMSRETGWTDIQYYIVSGKNCARFSYHSSYYRTICGLSFIPDGGITWESFDCESPDKLTSEMWLSGNILTIVQRFHKSYFPPPHGQSIPSIAHDDYLLTIDISTGETLSTELHDSVTIDVYGFPVRMDGTFYGEYLPATSAKYSDKHTVVLNGSVMRSYSLKWPNLGLYNPNDGSYPDYYWICVEDLENYGYDMAVDYENRATYFTRNSSKPITPMNIEGTDDELHIYESDWKIYIDGVEPKYYFNIGGYTLIYSKILGESEYRDGNSNVLYVTTPDMGTK